MTENMTSTIDADKAREAAAAAKLAAMARREMGAAESAADKTLAGIAVRYGRVGELLSRSGLAVRAFAILAEYGDRETFAATGLAQPRKLSSYKRASYVYTACDAVGSDVREACETYAADVREREASGEAIVPTLAGFAEYCAAGFTLPYVKGPKAPSVPKDLSDRVTTWAKGLSADELDDVAAMFHAAAVAARKAERVASKAAAVAA